MYFQLFCTNHRPYWTGKIMFAMDSEGHKYNGIWSNKRFRKIKDIARPGNQCSSTRDKKYKQIERYP